MTITTGTGFRLDQISQSLDKGGKIYLAEDEGRQRKVARKFVSGLERRRFGLACSD
ncbi:MAG TPA: hypothetical protein VFZ34_02170 [Blastocatellia bacterium]|nr:hypothetical protein [Blastocatellia bacterium]